MTYLGPIASTLQFTQNGSAKVNPDQMEYSGELDLNGRKSGYGFQMFSDGKIAFAGHWKKNVREGEGTEFYPNGVVKVKEPFLF
jgi:antitoxin component YwqK of YwqJK toxin-antitoxin module